MDPEMFMHQAIEILAVIPELKARLALLFPCPGLSLIQTAFCPGG
jgi:hypothetical protein